MQREREARRKREQRGRAAERETDSGGEKRSAGVTLEGMEKRGEPRLTPLCLRQVGNDGRGRKA